MTERERVRKRDKKVRDALSNGAGSGMAGMAAAIQSKIWYGDAIPIKSRAANFFYQLVPYKYTDECTD